MIRVRRLRQLRKEDFNVDKVYEAYSESGKLHRFKGIDYTTEAYVMYYTDPDKKFKKLVNKCARQFNVSLSSDNDSLDGFIGQLLIADQTDDINACLDYILERLISLDEEPEGDEAEESDADESEEEEPTQTRGKRRATVEPNKIPNPIMSSRNDNQTFLTPPNFVTQSTPPRPPTTRTPVKSSSTSSTPAKSSSASSTPRRSNVSRRMDDDNISTISGATTMSNARSVSEGAKIQLANIQEEITVINGELQRLNVGRSYTIGQMTDQYNKKRLNAERLRSEINEKFEAINHLFHNDAYVCSFTEWLDDNLSEFIGNGKMKSLTDEFSSMGAKVMACEIAQRDANRLYDATLSMRRREDLEAEKKRIVKRDLECDIERVDVFSKRRILTDDDDY